MNKFCAAAIQMPTVEDKMENIKAVRHYLEQIKAQKVDFVVLPEMFCCPYQTEKFPEYAEEEGGSVWKALSAYAKEYNIYLVAGSVPEKDDEGRVYIPAIFLTGRVYRLESTERHICLILM